MIQHRLTERITRAANGFASHFTALKVAVFVAGLAGALAEQGVVTSRVV